MSDKKVVGGIIIRKHVISLSEDGRVTLTAYLLDSLPQAERRARAAVLVLPGGGYRNISEGEADPIALSYLAQGYHSFVLRYSVEPHAEYPLPLLDASRAMAYIRTHALEWEIDSDCIAVCGMSAGGHLAACLGTMWHHRWLADRAGIAYESNKPNALILGYPVITCQLEQQSPLDKMWACAAGEQLLPSMQRQLSCELLVNKQTPPSFIFHTCADQVVPVEHALLFGQALASHGVSFELHIYPNGQHGLSLANEVTAGGKTEAMDEDVAGWMRLSHNWLRRQFKG